MSTMAIIPRGMDCERASMLFAAEFRQNRSGVVVLRQVAEPRDRVGFREIPCVLGEAERCVGFDDLKRCGGFLRAAGADQSNQDCDSESADTLLSRHDILLCVRVSMSVARVPLPRREP